MTGLTDVDLAVFGVEVLVLTACAVALVGAMFVYRRHVLYRTGVGWLAASLVLVTVGAIVELYGLLVRGDGIAVVAMTLYTAASAAITISMWTFARGFIELDQSEDAALDDEQTDTVSITTPAGDRGFEDAGQ